MRKLFFVIFFATSIFIYFFYNETYFSINPFYVKNFISLIIFAPIIEEFIFRKIILEYFITKKYNIILSSIIVSTLFTITHLFFNTTFFTLLIFFPSIILCYIYYKSRSYKNVVILHSIFNLNYFLFILL